MTTNKFTAMKGIAAVAALVLVGTPVFGSTPQSIFIPDSGGVWRGTWKKVPWYPQPYFRKPGEATYIRGTRRGGNIVTIERLRRTGSLSNSRYSIHIDKYDCVNDTRATEIEVLAWRQNKYNRKTDKAIKINGIGYWWQPRSLLRSRPFEMEPPRIGTYGAELQDAVCNKFR